MLFFSIAAAICFIVSHGGPADHFATFAEKLSKEGKSVEIYASGPALKKFQERNIAVKVPFSIDPMEEDSLAEQMAKSCANASVVITDVGHPFAVKIQKALARHGIHRLAYYDNLEPYVPGGYSVMAAEVMHEAEGTLFANANLAEGPVFQFPGREIDFGNRKKIGIGYYPIDQAEKIAEKRIEKKSDPKIFVYFGGNNEEYFSKAFPAFLSILEHGDFRDLVIVLQQHPGAKIKNIDRKMFEDWIEAHESSEISPKMIVSERTTEEAQIMADGAFYYQTSMGPQFVLAGIPTIQIGHERYEDILVKNGFIPSVTNVEELRDALHRKRHISKQEVLQVLGMKADWFSILKEALIDE